LADLNLLDYCGPALKRRSHAGDRSEEPG
jgi:hypothetical protein